MIRRLIPLQERPLIARDLLLTFRNFVPLFWRNLALAFIVVFATAARGRVSVFVFCAAGVYLIAATTSALLALQRPFRGFERVLPISMERLWRAKIGYAVLLSFPIPGLVWGMEMAIRPLSFEEGASLLIRLLLVGIAVALLTGGTICEGDQRPSLHAIIAAFLSALATFFIVALHPALILLLFPVLAQLRNSAVIRLQNEEIES